MSRARGHARAGQGRRLHSRVSRALGSCDEPVQRSPLRVCHGQNQHAFRVELECNQIRELPEKRLSNWSRSNRGARPERMQSRGSFKPLEGFVDSLDELIAQPRTPLFIPERSGADFCASFRMKFDPHDGRQVPSEFPHVRLSTTQATRVLREHRPIAEEVRRPRRPQLLRLSLPGSTVAPTRYERVLRAITEAPQQAGHLSTSSSV